MLTVLWDWNGTLLNDVALCSNLINEMLTRHGYAPVGDINAYKNVFCFPIEAYYKNAGFDFSRHPFAQLADLYTELYTPRSLQCTLQPGAQQVLDTLRQNGVRQVILSASQRDKLAQQVEHFGLTNNFFALVGCDNVLGSSKIAAGATFLQKSGINPAQAVMVGDSVHDYEVAHAMGTRCILYSGGHQTRAALTATGAPVADTLTEVFTMLSSDFT